MKSITIDPSVVQQALEALEICAVRQEHQWHGLQQVQIVKAALRAALEQPVQEPVAWRYQNSNTDHVYLVWKKGTGGRNWTPLFTHPPRREWRGLKEWEINDGLDQIPSEDVCSWSFRKGVYFAEAALKERNL
jgi:hypothetical protein